LERCSFEQNPPKEVERNRPYSYVDTGMLTEPRSVQPIGADLSLILNLNRMDTASAFVREAQTTQGKGLASALQMPDKE
jgi:hypothetical protein